jgi:phosphate transport system substrate-binding protein
MKTTLLLIGCLWCGLTQADNTIIKAAGATFPQPLYEKSFKAYTASTRVRIDYQAVGSGKGIQELMDRTVDMGATDAFMLDRELTQAPGPVLHVPTCLGAVAIIYNLPQVPSLQLTPELLAGIYLGAITWWSHKDMQKANPRAKLPGTEIVVVHRSESSGTTSIFTDYLCKVSTSWCQKAGQGKTVGWPTGMGVEANAGVAQMVQRVPGSIGYVELTYAVQNKLSVAGLRNRAGNFIQPTLETVSAAALAPLPPDMRTMLTDTPAPTGYPICAFTYLLVYQEQAYQQRTEAQARQLQQLLHWMIGPGQAYTHGLYYAPLPQPAVTVARAILETMTYHGRPLSAASAGR